MDAKIDQQQGVNEEPTCSYFEEKFEDAPSLEVKKEDIKDENNQKNYVEGGSNTNNFDIPDMPEEYKDTYQAYINEVQAMANVPITQTVSAEHINTFKHFNMRYYEDKYCINFIDCEKGYNDILIRIHSNKLFLVSLASGNDIITSNKEVTEINFKINNSDRSDIKLGGKRKKGAKTVERHTILCQVKCEGIPKMFNIRAGVPGRIIEINESIKTKPNLLRECPKEDGFLAVLAPKGHPSNYENVLNSLKLLSEEEYFKYLNERPPTFCELSKDIILKYNS